MSILLDPSALFWLPEASATWPAELHAALSNDPSGRLLRGACSARLSVSQLRKVKSGMAAHERLGASFAALRSLRVGLLGSGTLDFLADVLPGTAPRFGMRIEVAPVQFNGIGMAPFGGMGLEPPLDVVVIVPDAQTFRHPTALLDRANHDAAVAAAAETVQRIVATLRGAFNCAIVVATIPLEPDRVTSGADRAIFGTHARFVDDLNARIIEMSADQGLALWDLATIAATVGARQWRDPVSMHVAKSPFAIALAPLVADRLCSVIAPLVGKSRRALVLDLDNTLWGGVIGDDGLDGIVIGQGDVLGEAYLAVQRFALDLRRRGIVLCACSKNADEIAREPFRSHPDMLLRESDIAIFQANWNDKASNVKAIADGLALDLDALVFVDDNPAERARIRQSFPEVAVPELPDDPAFFVSCIAAGGYFETAGLNPDDLNRAEAYEGNARRVELRETLGDYEDYLRSLRMTLSIRPFDRLGRSRIAQLVNKSNQFNLTTRRRNEAEIEALDHDSNYVGLQCRLTDVFGDNGMISVIILRNDGENAVIDTWLMSCRVLERGVESAVLNEIVSAARQMGVRRVIGEYLPTPRNGMVREHYARLGFSALGGEGDSGGGSLWALDVATFTARPVAMAIERAQSGADRAPA